MIDLLASIEPASIPLLAVLAFSISLYPLGLMLGAPCSPCCGQCSSCVEGQLPQTVTVTFNGFEELVPGPDLIALDIDACFGDGAAARVTEPFGDFDTNAGPITAVEMTSGGAGYAVLGRVEPTVTITGDGSGATFTVTYTSSNDSCGRPRWTISSVAVSGGDNYTDGETLTVTADEDTVEEVPASLTLTTIREEPTATADVTGGGGAADLTPTFTEFPDDGSGRPFWSLTGLTITFGGLGYSVNDIVFLTVTDGVEILSPSAYVSAVDGNGAITAITIDDGGAFYKDSGVPDEVTVDASGTYYGEDQDEPAIVADITVSVASQALPSDGTGATFTATVDDDPASETFGEITGITVDDGGDDYLAYELLPTCLSRFDGRTIVLKRFVAGELGSSVESDFAAPGADVCSRYYQCVGDSRICMPEREYVSLTYNGIDTPASLNVAVVNLPVDPLFVFTGASASLEAAGNITNCSEFDIEGEPAEFFPSGGDPLPEGATATVVPGGEYEEPECKEYYIENLIGVKCTIEWDGQTFEVEYGEGVNVATPSGDCGLIGMSYSVFEVLDGVQYGNSIGVTNSAAAYGIDNRCRVEWFCGGELNRSVGLTESSYSFSTARNVPVDDDGYPSGTITLRGTLNGSTEDPPPPERLDATVTFSRVLP